MLSDELKSTPLGTETAQNHFSTKAERMPLVTNATEYLYVCVLFKCICVCGVSGIWRANREGIVYQITLWLAAEKPSSNNVLLRYTYLY